MAKSNGKIVIDVELDGKKATKQLDNVEKGVKDVGESTKKVEKNAKSLGDSLSKAFKVAGGVIAGLGIAKVVSAFGDFIEANREAVQDLARLDTNSQKAGVGLAQARDEMAKLQAITGEADSSVEAVSNLLASGFKGENLSKALEQISGAAIKFSDTLKVEGIADGLQETLATGSAIGPFAELLERSGVNLDTFNAGLEKATGSADKQNYVLQQLSKLGLTDTLDTYKETNKEAYNFELATAKNEQASANLANALLPLQTQFVNFKTRILEAIQSFLTFDGSYTQLIANLASKAPEASQVLVGWITDGLNQYATIYPVIIEKGTEIISQLILGIISALPTIIETIVNLGLTIVTTLVNNLPNILVAGNKILQSLIKGIQNFLPKLPPIILKVVTTLLTALVKNLPAILKGGVQILQTLTNGILSLIPTLARVAFQIVTGLVSYLVGNLPNILSAGGRLIKGLVSGLTGSLSSIWNVAKNIGSGLLSRLKGISLTDIGKNIISGLTKGFTAGVDKVLGVAKSIGNKVKNVFTGLFDIHSPSRWMRDMIAGNLIKGFDVGINKYTPRALKATTGLVEGIQSDLGGIVNNSTNNNATNFNNVINYNARGNSIQELELMQRRQQFLVGG